MNAQTETKSLSRTPSAPDSARESAYSGVVSTATAAAAIVFGLSLAPFSVPSAEVRSTAHSPAVFLREDEIQAILRKLRGFALLDEDFDGYGGRPPTMDAINAAVRFVQQLRKAEAPLPRPLVAGDGEVQLFWDQGGNYIDVGFSTGDEMSFYARTAKLEAPIGSDEAFDGNIAPALLAAIKSVRQ